MDVKTGIFGDVATQYITSMSHVHITMCIISWYNWYNDRYVCACTSEYQMNGSIPLHIYVLPYVSSLN